MPGAGYQNTSNVGGTDAGNGQEGSGTSGNNNGSSNGAADENPGGNAGGNVSGMPEWESAWTKCRGGRKCGCFHG